ncbi:MAG: Rieske (2Fe-2S) protein [Mycobacteriaceae bacterium]
MVTRRQVLCGAALGLLAPGALAACSAGHVGESPVVSSAPGTRLGALADVPVGGGTLVNGPAGKVLLVQPTAGTVKAFDARCPHAETVVGTPVGGVITCPGHGSKFDGKSGALEQGPARTGLLSVPVTVSGSDVVLA